MSQFRSSTRAFLLGCLLLAATSGIALADEVSSKLRTAWEKFSELQEVSISHGARGEIALKQMQAERHRADLLQTIRTMQVEVVSWRFPRHRWNNLQEDFFQELQGYRQQLTDTDRYLGELRLQWQQENEAAIRQAEAQGKRVKPLDRPGLLAKLQGQERETFGAFAEARKAIADAGTRHGQTRTQVYRQAMTELGRSGQAPAQLVPQEQFRAAFEKFCGGKPFFGPKGKRATPQTRGIIGVR